MQPEPSPFSNFLPPICSLGFPGGSGGKESACNGETQVWSLCQEDRLEKEMATHSSILVWRIIWTEQPGGLQSMGSQTARQTWATNTFTFNLLLCCCATGLHHEIVVITATIPLQAVPPIWKTHPAPPHQIPTLYQALAVPCSLWALFIYFGS